MQAVIMWDHRGARRLPSTTAAYNRAATGKEQQSSKDKQMNRIIIDVQNGTAQLGLFDMSLSQQGGSDHTTQEVCVFM